MTNKQRRKRKKDFQLKSEVVVTLLDHQNSHTIAAFVVIFTIIDIHTFTDLYMVAYFLCSPLYEAIYSSVFVALSTNLLRSIHEVEIKHTEGPCTLCDF